MHSSLVPLRHYKSEEKNEGNWHPLQFVNRTLIIWYNSLKKFYQFSKPVFLLQILARKQTFVVLHNVSTDNLLLWHMITGLNIWKLYMGGISVSHRTDGDVILHVLIIIFKLITLKYLGCGVRATFPRQGEQLHVINLEGWFVCQCNMTIKFFIRIITIQFRFLPTK